MRKFKALVAVAASCGAMLVALVGPAVAVASLSAAPAAAVTPADLGASSDTAAGSCWEIKQDDPTAADGDYWLLTPKMYAPQRFYCDMTTDGGGWVLIGQGRNGWTKNVNALGSASGLLTAGLSTMSAATYQYSATTIDGLLNGARVDSLPDGVRLRRAMDTTGSTWQEVRMGFSKFGQWAWAFGALYPLSSWSFAPSSGVGASGAGGTSQNFGSDSAYNRVTDVPSSGNGWSNGFAYGSGVTGSSDSTSYLWSPQNAGGALPFTEVFIRPHVDSNDPGFTAIPDSGTPRHEQPSVAESDALGDPWAVGGLAGTTAVEGDVEVQAFTQSGDNMYVGGNFAYVEQDASGTGRVQQSYLAAFNIDTGQWVSSFRPQLNEQVMSLATLPNGDVVAGGQFSQANGQPATAVVALDPTTGATDPNWNLTVQNRKTAGVVQINALDVYGDYLYLGGSFTHLLGGSKLNLAVYDSNLGRVAASDGTPDGNWNGDLNGTVNSISGGSVPNGADRVYAAGYFTEHGTTPSVTPVAALNAVALEEASGAALATPAWNPTWSNSNSYQRAIDSVGNTIWVGGSEHSLFQFDPTTFERKLGDIMYDKGDIQAISDHDGTVYAGCHCNYFDYENDYAWPNLTPNWTRADGMNWFGAWDAGTGARVPQFAPDMASRSGAGIWAIMSDSNGTVWAGGDITKAATATKRSAWAGGFARFPLDDSTAPGTPTGFHVVSQTASTVTLGWDGVSDPSGVTYQVLRDDRPIVSTTRTSITVPTSTSGRFFVRAADGAGNVSASTPVLVVGTGQIPPSASFTWSADHNVVTVDASSSSSPDGQISSYLWDFGDQSGAHGVTYSHTYASAGNYVVTLTVTDADGATDSASEVVTAGAPPVNSAPADSYGRQIYQDDPWAYYRLDESSGATSAHDSGPDGRDGTYNASSSITFGTPGALANSTDTAITTNGSSGFVSSPSAGSPPGTFTIEIWFKTVSTLGGRLIGYSSSNSGSSSMYDRHIYIQNNGHLVFGAYTGQEVEVVSPGSYNDGQWHMAVATMSPGDGMKLYVDGALVGSNPNGIAQNFVGYWRVGGDNLWDGASSDYLNGSLDEAAIFTHVLSAQQIATEYTDGSTTITPPANTPPTASFTASMNGLVGHFDASASTDTDGTISSYAWNFGDGTTGTGQLDDHTFPAAGTYSVTLTVTDNDGAQATAQQSVTATPPPVTSVAIPDGATWSYRYVAGAPPAGWNTQGFDASAWTAGPAVIGFGDASVTTNIDTFASPADRPLAAYFVHQFQVSDAAQVTKLVLDTVANDGIVVYVNGTEVNRTNMPSGTITSDTYATTAVNTANAPQVTVDVPTSLLIDGTNVIAAETHLNYHKTRDITFDLKATLTTTQ